MCTFGEVGVLLPIYVINSLQKLYVVVCRFCRVERLAMSGDLCGTVVSVSENFNIKTASPLHFIHPSIKRVALSFTDPPHTHTHTHNYLHLNSK
jgi:hypothetical protein